MNVTPFDAPSPDDYRYDPKNEATFRRQLTIWAHEVWAALSGDVTPRSVSNASRPAFGKPGRTFYNTDDGNLNIDTGSSWILPDGTVT